MDAEGAIFGYVIRPNWYDEEWHGTAIKLFDLYDFNQSDRERLQEHKLVLAEVDVQLMFTYPIQEEE